MLQRLFHSVLKQGFEQVIQTSDVLERFFREQWDLSVTESTEIAKYMLEHPLKIVHGYARTNLTSPILSIILAQEKEDEQVLGTDGGMVDDPDDPDYGADVCSSIWNHSYQVLTLAENADLTTYYYEMAKRILFLAKPYLATQGLLDIQLGGQDLAPDPQYTGDMLFARMLTISCRAPMDLPDAATQQGKVWKVGGIAIDSAGSPSDVGGVKTGITVGVYGG